MIRGGDAKQRLRVGLEGDGWILVRKGVSGYFVPTSYRLATLLARIGVRAVRKAGVGNMPLEPEGAPNSRRAGDHPSELQVYPTGSSQNQKRSA